MLRTMRTLMPWRDTPRRTQDHLPARGFQSLTGGAFDPVSQGFLDPWQNSLLDALSDGERFRRDFGAPVDVQEDEKGYAYRVEVPGYDPKDIDVSVERDQILIRGRHTEESGKEDEDGWSRTEGSLFLTVPVPPDGQAEEATAKVRNGILRIRVPRASDEQMGIKRIPVDS